MDSSLLPAAVDPVAVHRRLGGAWSALQGLLSRWLGLVQQDDRRLRALSLDPIFWALAGAATLSLVLLATLYLTVADHSVRTQRWPTPP